MRCESRLAARPHAQLVVLKAHARLPAPPAPAACRYEQGDAPDFSREAWLSVKASIPVDFSNLPYFLDNDTKITQSGTILRYIARKYGAGTGLYDGTIEELTQIDLMYDQTVRGTPPARRGRVWRDGTGGADGCAALHPTAAASIIITMAIGMHPHRRVQVDLRTSVTRAVYGAMSFDSLKAMLPSALDGFEKLLAKDGRAFLAGAKVSIADFAFQEVLDVLAALASELWSEDAFAAYPTIKAYKARFEALPAIAEYRASAKFLARPFNNKVAKWM